MFRTPENRNTKQPLVSELHQGQRSEWYKRYKDSLKAALKICGRTPNLRENNAANRFQRRKAIKDGIAGLDKNRTSATQYKRQMYV